MRRVLRSEILDWVTYSEQREAQRAAAIGAKERRRVLLGPWLCFLFENRETVRYQVHEMLRAERIVREADVVHELDTYNELLGGDGEIGCTLLIGIDDPSRRDERLRRWRGLNAAIYVRMADGRRLRARWDERQVGEERLSAVQYLRFPVGGEAPVALGCDFDDGELRGEVELGLERRAAIEADLRDP